MNINSTWRSTCPSWRPGGACTRSVSTVPGRGPASVARRWWTSPISQQVNKQKADQTIKDTAEQSTKINASELLRLCLLICVGPMVWGSSLYRLPGTIYLTFRYWNTKIPNKVCKQKMNMLGGPDISFRKRKMRGEAVLESYMYILALGLGLGWVVFVRQNIRKYKEGKNSTTTEVSTGGVSEFLAEHVGKAT